jgi:Ca2+-binding EF-hand superfamily protein
MNINRLCLVAAGAVVFAGPAVAQQVQTPLPPWFAEIDTAKRGYVTRDEFVAHGMAMFERLNTAHNGRLTLDEYLKSAEPPTEERRARARAGFQAIDTNRNGTIERDELEAELNAEFNAYDLSHDGKVTEAEIRLVDSRKQREVEEAQRRSTVTLAQFIDMQLAAMDRVAAGKDGRIRLQDFVVAFAGPPDGPQAQGLPPYDLRKRLATQRFQEIDAAKEGYIDRVKVTSYAVRKFVEMDRKKRRLLDQEDFRVAQETDFAKLRASSPPKAPPPPVQPPKQELPPGLPPR